MQFTNYTTRKPLFLDLYDPYRSYGSYCRGRRAVGTNGMQVTIVPRPVRLVNQCFTPSGGTSRTSRVKPLTGRICSTVLDKDESMELKLKPMELKLKPTGNVTIHIFF